MKTFADLRRTIKVGTRLRVVQHDYRPELTGQERIVTKVQTNGYFFEDPSRTVHHRMWSGFAPAGCYSFPTPDTYRQDEGVKCNCGSPAFVTHSKTCAITTGRRQAWTVQIVEVAA